MNFKKITYTISFLLTGLICMISCEYDNFDPPSSQFTGRVVYQGQPIPVRSQGVQLEIWQRGYELSQKVPLHVDQDGSFSAMLFDGDYQVTLLNNNGPWLNNTDTLHVQVRGNTVADMEVMPYYVLANESYNKAGAGLSVSFNIEEAYAERDIEFVALYAGRTQFTDRVRHEAALQIAGGAIDPSQPVTINMELPSNLSGRPEIFARVGLKVVGVEELVYTQIQKLN